MHYIKLLLHCCIFASSLRNLSDNNFLIHKIYHDVCTHFTDLILYLLWEGFQVGFFNHSSRNTFLRCLNKASLTVLALIHSKCVRLGFRVGHTDCSTPSFLVLYSLSSLLYALLCSHVGTVLEFTWKLIQLSYKLFLS